MATVIRSPLLQFGKVPIRVAGLLLGFYLLVSIVPSLLYVLALVPANTMMVHFFFWNVFTAGFVNDSFIVVRPARSAHPSSPLRMLPSARGPSSADPSGRRRFCAVRRLPGLR